MGWRHVYLERRAHCLRRYGEVRRDGLPPAQSSADDVLMYIEQWKKGAQSGPSEVIGHGAEVERMAGGISGTGAPSEAAAIAAKYHSAGVSSAIVWMVKPDQCSDMTGWVADNSQLPQWTTVL